MNDMHAMPLLLGILCLMAIAYRYYSAFLAAKVATLDDLRQTPAEKYNDGHNYHPTNKWVLFGHHFAAISGAGPLVGPVLAAQFGYLPGLLWIVIGVCLAGAVQDFLVLAVSTRREGKSLAQIAFGEIGKTAGAASMAAILFIIIIALAGLGKVVVNALGGDEVKYPNGSVFELVDRAPLAATRQENGTFLYHVPAETKLRWGAGFENEMRFNDGFDFVSKSEMAEPDAAGRARLLGNQPGAPSPARGGGGARPSPPAYYAIPPGSVRLMPGSPWGTFTIACTIPIALFVGLYMYKIRPGKTVEASIIGAVLTLGATVLGAWVPGTALGEWFNLKDTTVIWAMAVYGFVASVLPVWILLLPRDYLSSFLKIGTIGLLVVGTLVANPRLEAPAFNRAFSGGGPVVPGSIFPFLFITIMCGAASGFHALVSSGTTPKMVRRESHTRAIGYGAMLMEGLVAVVAMIAAASLPVGNYYAMNTGLANVPKYHDKFVEIGADVDHLNVDEARTQETLRGRASGAVTLAVGMTHIFDDASRRFFGKRAEAALEKLWKYWYHFAIMFEALFILTTIDAGTRIGRFLLQEVAGKIHPQLGRPAWAPGAVVSTLLVVLGWGYFIRANSMDAIWPMFGIANQMLVVIALSIVSAVLVNEGKSRYLLVTVVPLLVVLATTTTAAVEMLVTQARTVQAQWAAGLFANGGAGFNALVRAVLIVMMMGFAYTVILASGSKLLPKKGAPRGFAVAGG